MPGDSRHLPRLARHWALNLVPITHPLKRSSDGEATMHDGSPPTAPEMTHVGFDPDTATPEQRRDIRLALRRECATCAAEAEMELAAAGLELQKLEKAYMEHLAEEEAEGGGGGGGPDVGAAKVASACGSGGVPPCDQTHVPLSDRVWMALDATPKPDEWPRTTRTGLWRILLVVQIAEPDGVRKAVEAAAKAWVAARAPGQDNRVSVYPTFDELADLFAVESFMFL